MKFPFLIFKQCFKHTNDSFLKMKKHWLNLHIVNTSCVLLYID